MGHYIEKATSRVSAFKLGWVFVLFLWLYSAATGEISCYNCIARLRSLPLFAETVSQGYSSTARMDPRLARVLRFMQYCLNQFTVAPSRQSLTGELLP